MEQSTACGRSSVPASIRPVADELEDLSKDLLSIGMISIGRKGRVCGSVSLRSPEGGLLLLSGMAEGPDGGGAWMPVILGTEVGDAAGEQGDGGACLEARLHSAVYEGASEAGCAAVLVHEVLHGQLIRGDAPAASGSEEDGKLCRSLKDTASRRSEDGIIVLPGVPEAFVMYAPTVSHLRDLLYMLGQGYIPM